MRSKFIPDRSRSTPRLRGDARFVHGAVASRFGDADTTVTAVDYPGARENP
jgi:hypothetical protein